MPGSPSASPEDSFPQCLQLSFPNPPCWRESCCCQGAQQRNRPSFVLRSGAEGSLELLLNSFLSLPAQFLSIHGIKFSSLLDLKLRREILAGKASPPAGHCPTSPWEHGLCPPLFVGLLHHPRGIGCLPPLQCPRHDLISHRVTLKSRTSLQNKWLCFSALKF